MIIHNICVAIHGEVDEYDYYSYLFSFFLLLMFFYDNVIHIVFVTT